MDQNQFSKPILTRETKDTILVKNKDINSVKHDSLSVKFDTTKFKTSSTVKLDTVEIQKPVENTSTGKIPEIIPFSSVTTSYERTPWFIAVLLIILLLVSKIKMSFPRLTPLVLVSFLRSVEATKLLNSRNTRNNVCYFIMNVLTLIVSSVFVFELLVFYGFIINASFLALLYINILIFAFALFKIIIAKILAFVFRSSIEAVEYSFNMLLIWKTVGILLVPVVLCIPFVKYSAINIFNIIGVSIIGIAYVLIIFRGLKILFSKHVSFLYMILYLCALEMVPLTIAYKSLIAN